MRVRVSPTPHPYVGHSYSVLVFALLGICFKHSNMMICKGGLKTIPAPLDAFFNHLNHYILSYLAAYVRSQVMIQQMSCM